MPNKSENEKIYPLVQTEIQRYVMAHLMPQCTSEPLRFSERELARTLKVNRLTVHRAAEDMLRRGYLIQIPGRRGLFLNPDCQASGRGEKYYGVLTGGGEVPIMAGDTNQILKGFLDTAQNFSYIDCQFLSLNAKTPERMVSEIISYPLHALIWFFPTPEVYPVIDLLLEKSVPAAVVNSLNDARMMPFHTNSVSLDFRGLGVKFAEKVLSEGVRSVLFAGLDSNIYHGFCDCMAAHSIPFPSRNFIEYSPEHRDPNELAAVIRKNKIELVVSDGMLFHDLEKLSGLLDFSALQFLLLPMRRVKSLAAAHPEYPLLFPDLAFDGTLATIGKLLAGKIGGEVSGIYFRNETAPLVCRKTR